jgi:glycosyltransferase involved in cell wall biosynthesis
MRKFWRVEAGSGRRGVLLVEFFGRGGLLHYSAQLARGLRAVAAPGVEVMLLCGRALEAGVVPEGVRLAPWLCTWNPHARPRLVPRRLLRAWRGLLYGAAWVQVGVVVARRRPELVVLGDLEHRIDGWGTRWLHRRLGRQRPPGRLADIWHNLEPFGRAPGEGVVRPARWRRPMARQFDTVFVHGDHLARAFEALTGRPAHAIAHGNQDWLAELAGADPRLDERLRLPPDRPLALLLGALSAYKGVEVLLAALALIPPARRPCVLIAGMPSAGAPADAWQQEAARLGLEPFVRWDLRYVPSGEIAWYFRRADLVVLPYRAAAQSGVAHLALSFGRPLLVTAVGGLPELIAGNGLVVPPDDAAALARALEQMSGDEEARRRWGEQSRQLAEVRHGWPAIARQVLAAAAPHLLASGGGAECYQGMAAKEGARRVEVASES